MSSNTFFILLLVVALVGMTLITETVRRIRHQRMLTYHLEHFTRFDTTENPHAVYDAYFNSRHTARNTIIDDKTWSDLSMDLLFDKLNATYTSIGENHLYSALRLQTSLVHYEFLEQLRPYPNQHREIVKRLVDLGKSIYPNYDKDILKQQYQWIYAFLLAMPFVGLMISFFNLGIGLLWIC
ncbi:TPA: DNA mismatch repair protein MutS, partial [Staphylococcus pseudintermedius]|nr:DNA mismatch repair protein MutS [Staphylococcus pseudintermedius]